MKYIARKPESNVNVTPTSRLRELLVLGGSLLALAVALYVVMGLAVDFIAPRLSIGFEEKMGRLVVSHVVGKPTSPGKITHLQSIVDDFQHRCVKLPYKVTVHLKESEAINALALPGGHIVVFTGLLKKLESENELAFILAHEMGHFAHRDHLRGLGRGLVFMVLSVFIFGPESNVADLLTGALGLTEMRFSRAQENRADAFALDVLNCRFGHVTGATDFFSKIPREQDPGRYGHYFSSHPENRRRIDALNQLSRKRGYTAGQRIPLKWDPPGR